ncbi:hypothetical protein [Candidatus Liberibacter solanacearum]|uniref:Uncharacterized protein n=1 Tax=Candidatus Liberibacter solanacearum TaxID=556287 RepID=A0A1V2N9L6_9HYPH|nr:hypothetical protein [Candidatus Liberibacter solanacearum]ONI58692.1 hypothetical protein AYJ09_04760 [Candidatus Liberibacter solanacearum]ONI60300.1 hypothetical protein AYO25_00335 [Candidatus Liberibacter solanacearum]
MDLRVLSKNIKKDVKCLVNLSSDIDIFLKSYDEDMENKSYCTLMDLLDSHNKNNNAFMKLLDEFKLEIAFISKRLRFVENHLSKIEKSSNCEVIDFDAVLSLVESK